MKVVKPITIGNAALAASSVPEPDASLGEVVWVNTGSTGAIGSYSSSYHSSSLGGDGNIYCIGRDARVLKINTQSQAMSLLGTSPGLYYKSATSESGDIYAPSYNGSGSSGSILKISVSSQAVSNFGSYTGLYKTATVGSDNCMYCVGETGDVLKVDLATNSISKFGNYTGKYQSSSLGGDGNIYCVGVGDVLKIDTATQSVSKLGAYPGTLLSSSVGINGNIYCVGDGGKVLLIEVESQTVSRFGNFPGINVYTSSSLADDGNIYCVSSNSGKVLEIDPLNKKTKEYGNYSGRYFTSTLAPNGDIYCTGIASQNVITIKKESQVNDEVIQTDTHKRYKCVINNRDKPSDGVNKVPQTWVDIGPTNKWSPFDAKISTTLKSNSTYTNAIKDTERLGIGSVSAFGLNNVSSINIRATSASSGLMFNQTYPIVDTDELSVVGIPPMTDYTINMTFNKSSSGALEVGAIVPGKVYDLGTLQAGASSDVIDYSKSEYDEFGELVYVQRPIVKYSTYPIVIDRQYCIQSSRLLNALRGIPCVWIGNLGIGQNLVTYGAYERSPMTYNNPSIVELQIKVRGVI